MAVLKWGDVKPEEITGAPKMLDIKSFGLWVMYFTQVIEQCWEVAPETKREDVAAQLASVRFKMHGWRLQVDHLNAHYTINLASENVKRPPSFKRAPPKPKPAQASVSKIKQTAPTRAQPEGGKRPPRQTDKRIAALWRTMDLPHRTEAARRNAAAILSRLRASLARVKEISRGNLTWMAARIAQCRTRSASFVQHRVRRLLTRFRDAEADIGTARARLQPMWFGHLGMNLIVRTWEEIAPQIDWDSYPFGEPSKESELATG